jgi:DNA-binding HxlR family transcriptional regulator
MSSSVLNQRLAELQQAAVLERDEDGCYLLSGEGALLLEPLAQLNLWAERWALRAPPA